MAKLDKIEDIVINALEENKQARTDDYILFGAVLKRMGIDITLPMAVLLRDNKFYKLPAFESITRARRKIQESRKDLIDPQAAKFREEEMQTYIDYSHK